MAERLPRPARLGDVARAAGVHVSTASRVLNSSVDVAIREETRERIIESARRLRYRPNAMARGLKLAATGALGLLVPSLRNPVNSPIIRGAFDRAWAEGFVVLLAEDSGAGGTPEQAYERLVEEGRIDGLLIQSARLGNPMLDHFTAGTVPCVFIDRRHPGSGRNVCMRDEDAGRLAAEHFLELGHVRLGHLAGPPELDTVKRRCDGFVARAREAQIEPRLEVAELSEREGYEGMRRLLAHSPPPTAVFIANVNQAVGALAAVREEQLRPPDELSLICHDDDPVCEFLDVPLTAIDMPLYALGAAAVDALIEQIQGAAPRDVVVDTAPRLVLRGSTAPPPA
jgi:LacI family transcriptional regulator